MVWRRCCVLNSHVDSQHIHESVAKFGTIVGEDLHRGRVPHDDLVEEELCHIVAILRLQGSNLHLFDKVVRRNNYIPMAFKCCDQRPHQVHADSRKWFGDRYVGEKSELASAIVCAFHLAN